MQVAQPVARLDAELLDERPPRVVVALQRLGAAAGPVQREHQLRARPLTQRVLGHDTLQLGDQLLVTAERQLSLGPFLARAEAELAEPRQRRGRERRVREVCQRGAAGQCHGLAEQVARRPRVTARERLAAPLDESLAAHKVDRVGLDVEHISRGARDDRLSELAAQLRDVTVQRGRRRVRRLLAPDPGDQSVGGHDPAGFQREHRQHPAATGAADAQRPPPGQDLERPEHAQIQLLSQGLTVSAGPLALR